MKGTSQRVLNQNLVLVSATSTSLSVFLVHIRDYQRPHHFLRAKAAAIPPATTPTAAVAIPMPIIPSTNKPKTKDNSSEASPIQFK